MPRRTRTLRRALLFVAAAALLGLAPVELRSAAPAEAAYDPCGARVARPGGGYWTCTFADQFSGRQLDTDRWTPVVTAAGGFTQAGECFVNNPSTVKQAGGLLTLSVVRTAAPFTCASPRGSFTSQYAAGYVSTIGKFAQAYGRFEFRVRFPRTKVGGVHSALWLWPANPAKYGSWPASGEIDVAEFYSAYPDRVIPYVHYSGDKDDPSATNNYCFVTRPDTFHTYVLEWTPQTITVKYDGRTCIVADWQPDGMLKPAPFDQPFHLNLTQALGILGNAFEAESTPLPASMQADWVRVWR